MKQFAALTCIVLLCSFAANAGVGFILKNTSAKSIPLKIPGVMNPNLSPFSESGVNLEVGQQIFFTDRKKKYLLLEVTSELADTKVIVNKLIKERKKELELKGKASL